MVRPDSEPTPFDGIEEAFLLALDRLRLLPFVRICLRRRRVVGGGAQASPREISPLSPRSAGADNNTTQQPAGRGSFSPPDGASSALCCLIVLVVVELYAFWVLFDFGFFVLHPEGGAISPSGEPSAGMLLSPETFHEASAIMSRGTGINHVKDVANMRKIFTVLDVWTPSESETLVVLRERMRELAPEFEFVVFSEADMRDWFFSHRSDPAFARENWLEGGSSSKAFSWSGLLGGGGVSSAPPRDAWFGGGRAASGGAGGGLFTPNSATEEQWNRGGSGEQWRQSSLSGPILVDAMLEHFSSLQSDQKKADFFRFVFLYAEGGIFMASGMEPVFRDFGKLFPEWRSRLYLVSQSLSGEKWRRGNPDAGAMIPRPGDAAQTATTSADHSSAAGSGGGARHRPDPGSYRVDGEILYPASYPDPAYDEDTSTEESAPLSPVVLPSLLSAPARHPVVKRLLQRLLAQGAAVANREADLRIGQSKQRKKTSAFQNFQEQKFAEFSDPQLAEELGRFFPTRSWPRSLVVVFRPAVGRGAR